MKFKTVIRCILGLVFNMPRTFNNFNEKIFFVVKVMVKKPVWFRGYVGGLLNLTKNLNPNWFLNLNQIKKIIFLSSLNIPSLAWAQNEIQMPQNLVQAASKILEAQGTDSDPLNKALTSGLGNFSMANLIGGILFSFIGSIAFMYGKKQASFKPMVIGIALVVYPWFVTVTWLVYAVGIVLTAALFIFRD